MTAKRALRDCEAAVVLLDSYLFSLSGCRGLDLDRQVIVFPLSLPRSYFSGIILLSPLLQFAAVSRYELYNLINWAVLNKRAPLSFRAPGL